MIRSLKALGLGLIAMLAVSVISVSAASADAFTTESYPATITGGDDPGVAGTSEFASTGGVAKCPSATYHATLSGASTTLTVTPNLNGASDNCTVAGSIPAVVDLNGCDFLVHIGSGASTSVTADLLCPAGKEVTMTSNQNTAGSLTTKCTTHLPPQTLSGITYDNLGAGTTREIRATMNVSGITYTETAGTGLGACATSVLQHTGTLKGTDLLTAETDGGNTHIGFFLTESAV